MRKSKVKTQIANIRNERGDITTHPTVTKRIKKEYYEQLCANKLNLDKRENSMECLPTLTQEVNN